MFRSTSLSAVTAALLLSATPARADSFLCCTFGLGLNAGPCLPSATACDQAPYLVQFSDLQDDPTTEAFFGPSTGPGVLDASFPPGMDGSAWWQSGAPWEGVCLLAPSSADPMHEDPTEPAGCFDFALWPVVGAQLLTVTFQRDGRWDAYQVCYGSSTAGACSVADPTVSPLPVSGSCCGPASMLRDVSAAGQWRVSIASGIPGVPEPYAAADAGAGAFHPVVTSGAGPGCKPKTCASTRLTCANVDDGCGGTLSCLQGCKALAQACTAAPGGGDAPVAPIALAGALAAASRWRRRLRHR